MHSNKLLLAIGLGVTYTALLFPSESSAQSRTSDCSTLAPRIGPCSDGASLIKSDEKSPSDATAETPSDHHVLTASLQSTDGPPTFPAESSWDATRTFVGSGAQQKGAFRIINGGVYHLDQDQPVGMASLDGSGTLHLVFHGHRKFSGTAAVNKVANGHWAGLIVMPDGSEWRLDMRRR
jgi:hypothetical protein